MDEVLVFKILPYFSYGLFIILALSSGVLIYSGLSSRTERLQTRLRIRQSVKENNEKLSLMAEKSKAEGWLKEAEYPFKVNAFKYNIFLYGLILVLIFNYIVVPIAIGETISPWTYIILLTLYVFLLPNNPYSIFVYIVKRVIDYRVSKKNAEVFMLYDLLINELEMMTTTRINSYNLLRGMKPYFEVISGSFTKLLTTWSSDEGPEKALDKFAIDIGTKEAESLANVIKTLDDVERHTAIESLKGMNDMFVQSQIENYRRRRKVTTDLASLPIQATHRIIILNIIIVIVVMVSVLMDANSSM
ncbi:hypothetical protein [Halobacillus litoralis]|uniref:Type II secretion system protein GspF domain-containing protein n=1 Tax=Halobacillus litoralis TaxID=45668 RepID=A0A410MJE0_9BACI|nr:hypothetical protein [Halobacillus litoralis]QAS54823.1 hypothetical protein HLI_21460 [Halobacillus litoralis]